jgi:hypothetical protein
MLDARGGHFHYNASMHRAQSNGPTYCATGQQSETARRAEYRVGGAVLAWATQNPTPVSTTPQATSNQ